MSLGRPVEPPEVMAFSDAAVRSGNGASLSSRSGVKPSGTAGRGRVLILCAADDERGLAEVDDLVAFELREFRGNRLRRGAEFPCGEAGFDEGNAVGQADGDEVILLYAERFIGAGETVSALLKLGPGDLCAFMVDGDAIGLLVGPEGDDARQRDCSAIGLSARWRRGRRP